MFENFDDIVTIEDIMQMLRVGKNTAYGLVKEGHIAHQRGGVPRTV